MENIQQENIRQSKNWLIHLEWGTLMTAIIACSGFLLSEIRGLDNKIAQQSQRTDKLYEMFIDLIKEGRK